MDYSDIKNINPVYWIYYIHREKIAKPTKELQCRLNLNMKEVVRVEVLKLLDASVI